MSLPEIDAAFYFDLGCPLAYLAAEQVLTALGAPTSWRPVLASSLPDARRFDAFRCATEADVFREEIARRAQALGLHGRPLRDRLPVRADDDPLRAARDPVGLGDLPTRVCPTRGGHAPRLVLLDHRRRPHRADDGQLALAPGRHQRSDRGRRVDRERRARHDPVCRAARRVQDGHRTRHGHGPRKPDPSVHLLSWASAGSRG